MNYNAETTDGLEILNQEVTGCIRCPRLIRHCREVAQVKRRAYQDWDYWGKPVPSFGDPAARMLILGLAPGAHGANRTGRMFTGDSSGDFLYKALYRAGFATQPESTDRGDGLELRNAWISASAHCAPPDNKPSPAELKKCRPYLLRELELLRELKLVVVLGKIAMDTYLNGRVPRRADYPFGHNAFFAMPGGPGLLCSYHPSRQNTSTGRLTQTMLDEVFLRAAELTGCGAYLIRIRSR